MDFAEYVRSLAADLFSLLAPESGRVQLDLDVGEVSLDLERAIPCGLVLNELVSNALEHAFPAGRRGTVRLSLRNEAPGELRMTVGDDGVGLPAGLDCAHADSLGLQLVAALVGQLNGRLDVRRDGGTTFEVRFPTHPAGSGEGVGGK